MLELEANLSDLFGDNHMRMQSSTIYRALRGEGMRVTPLVSTKLSSEVQKVVVPSHMVVTNLKPKFPKKPGSAPADASATKTTYVGKIFDLRSNAPKDGLLKRLPSDIRLAQAETVAKPLPKPPTTTKVVMEFKKRDVVTPVSAASTQRVPFTSTRLEKQVSRESLKEEESDLKPKRQKKPAAGRKSALVPQDPAKLKSVTTPRPRAPPFAPQRLALYKHRRVKKAVEDCRRELQVKPVQNETLRAAPRLVPGSALQQPPGNAKKLPLGTARKPPTGSAQRQHSRGIGKPPSSSQTLRRYPPPGSDSKNNVPAAVKKAESRRSVAASNATAMNRKKAGGPGKKNVWIPTSEAVESWNQYCPASKAKVQRKTRTIKRRTIEFEDEKSISIRSGGSDMDDSDDESTAMDEEEQRRLREQAIRRKMEQNSIEFFNQFKYGEMLKKAIPKMRYNSEIPPDKATPDRLSDVEVRVRLSQLNESAYRINELMPKWSSMLMTTRESNREEQIRKTLTNAQHILDRKVDKAKEMLNKYINSSGQPMSSEEMADIKRHSELVQLDMNSLERMFAAHEKQLAEELDEPSSITP